MSKAELRVGDIIRVTRFGRTILGLSDPPAWAWVSGPPAGVHHLGDAVFLVGPDGVADSKEWPFDAQDIFEVVPDVDVPGEVWAALAKWRLTA